MTPLEARIHARIAVAGGWLPFDDFMAEALYAPGLGYYSSGRQTFGLSPQGGSDFVTAPELSPLFGRALAKQVAQALRLTQRQPPQRMSRIAGVLNSIMLFTTPTLWNSSFTGKFGGIANDGNVLVPPAVAAFGAPCITGHLPPFSPLLPLIVRSVRD